MTCHPITFPDGATGHVCSRTKPKKCHMIGCEAPAVNLCDYKLTGPTPPRPTCDRGLCGPHTYPQTSGEDFCSIHDDITALKQPVVTMPERTPAPAPVTNRNRQRKLPGLE